MYTYTALHHLHTPTHAFARSICLPSPITEQEYREYSSILLGKECQIRFYDWGQAPREVFAGVSADGGVIEGLTYDTVVGVEDIPAYVQFIQDLVALEKRRPVFKKHVPTIKDEPEYASMFTVQDRGLSTITGYDPMMYETSASVVDYTMSCEMLETVKLPDWIRRIGCVEAAGGDLPVLFRLPSRFDAAQLTEMTQGFEDISFHVLIGDGPSLSYQFDEKEKYFRSQYTSAWTVQGVRTFLEELVRQQSLTVLELSNGRYLLERPDGLWSYLFSSKESVHCVASLTLRNQTLIYAKDGKSERKILEPQQCTLLTSILQQAHVGFSLYHCFHMFHAKESKEAKVVEPKSSGVSTSAMFCDATLQMEKLMRDKFLTSDAIIPEDWKFTENEVEQLSFQAFRTLLNHNNIEYNTIVFQQDPPISLKGVRYVLQLKPETEWLMQGGRAPLFIKLMARLENQMGMKGGSYEFQTIIGIFCEAHVRQEEGKRTPSSELWSRFQQFLQTPRDPATPDVKYPCYSLTRHQSEFNWTLQSFGYEQKRIASGVVWCNMILV